MQPKLLYFSDVRIDESGGGSTILYRLLKNFDPETLYIIESGYESSKSGSQLNVGLIGQINPLFGSKISKRLANSRFSKFYRLLVGLNSSLFVANRIESATRGLPIDAVLTVAHGLSWIAAAQFAKRRVLPLHLIVHDAVEFTFGVPQMYLPFILKQFEQTYKTAYQAYCISPYMESKYAERFGRKGLVLLPGRDSDNPVFEFSKQAAAQANPTTFAYAGGLHNSGYRDLVFRAAQMVKRNGGRFLVYGPDGDACQSGVCSGYFEYAGNFKPRELIFELRDRADVLFCPQNFAAEERSAMEINFPSKLADYTAAGLPLWIWGPVYASSVRWASENPGVAMLTNVDSDGPAEEAIKSLSDWTVRKRLAEAAIITGAKQFGGKLVSQQFENSLISSLSPRQELAEG